MPKVTQLIKRAKISTLQILCSFWWHLMGLGGRHKKGIGYLSTTNRGTVLRHPGKLSPLG